MTLFVLLGPTAVGKTELSLQLAEHLGAPILNCDSRQIYRDIPICTAAPSEGELRRVKHYFVGTHGLDESYSAAQFERDVLHLLGYDPGEGGMRCKTTLMNGPAILSGGSMMYIDAVCKGIDEMPNADPAIRMRLREQLEEEGVSALCEQLRLLDPVYYATVDRQNPQRVLHGLEMCLTTGKPFSSFLTGQKKQRPFKIVKIGLRREREELYHRIDLRVEQMVEQGLMPETLRVYERYQKTVEDQLSQVIRNPGPTQKQPIPNLLPISLNTVGLKEMLLYHTGVYSFERAKERICHNSRIYSKKQMTWFQRDEGINWFHPDDFDKILHYISNSD